ncbi:Trihelix transcription factor GTL1 [Sesamum alatum]|uniref:Trihelix transcription factor GTL1 n=1 Tax=Sesamum alatum TaxID=300844 RepID=A0AAE1Y2U4_9LAMI|nr:Trihelix transcription factor GTL1 [Sesamum alatum]
MHSGFQIPETEHHHRHGHRHIIAPETSCTALLLSMNQTHNLEQIHGTLPTTQQLFLDQPGFLPPHLNHHYVGGATASPPFFPVKFKLDFNGTCTSNNIDGAVSRGSEQYQVPEARQLSSLIGMPHSWQNQQDSASKQQPFWEAQVSNENTDQEYREMNKKEAATNCLESKSRVLYGELEAIYKRPDAVESNQTGPSEILPVGFEHGSSEASVGELGASESMKKGKRKKRKGKDEKLMTNPMAEFFEGLVKQVMDHQDNLEKKCAELIERLDEERREREEAWRSHELARFEQEAEARAREKASAASREAAIVSYLEKITGQRINLPNNLKEMNLVD